MLAPVYGVPYELTLQSKVVSDELLLKACLIAERSYTMQAIIFCDECRKQIVDLAVPKKNNDDETVWLCLSCAMAKGIM